MCWDIFSFSYESWWLFFTFFPAFIVLTHLLWTLSAAVCYSVTPHLPPPSLLRTVLTRLLQKEFAGFRCFTVWTYSERKEFSEVTFFFFWLKRKWPFTGLEKSQDFCPHFRFLLITMITPVNQKGKLQDTRFDSLLSLPFTLPPSRSHFQIKRYLSVVSCQRSENQFIFQEPEILPSINSVLTFWVQRRKSISFLWLTRDWNYSEFMCSACWENGQILLCRYYAREISWSWIIGHVYPPKRKHMWTFHLEELQIFVSNLLKTHTHKPQV